MTSMARVFLKMMALLIVDMATIVFLWPAWMMFSPLVLPWSLFFLLLALVALHIVVLASPWIVRRFGVAALVASCSSTVFYYLFIVIFTRLSYPALPWRWHLTGLLLATLLVVALHSLFAFSRPASTREKGAVHFLRLLTDDMENAIHSRKPALSADDYAELMAGMERTRQRLEASTPFGRSSSSLILEQENSIVEKLREGHRLLTISSDIPDVPAIVNVLQDVYTMTVTRERLFVQ